MITGNIFGKINWETPNTLYDRIFLFCIEGKCMSGKVEEFVVLEPPYVEIKVAFIEPSYFEGIVGIGKHFTVQEASKVLAEGIVTKIW